MATHNTDHAPKEKPAGGESERAGNGEEHTPNVPRSQYLATHGGTVWSRVSTDRPCPICGKPDWCTITPDGTAACCMRTRNDKPAKNGGNMHQLAERVPTTCQSEKPADL